MTFRPLFPVRPVRRAVLWIFAAFCLAILPLATALKAQNAPITVRVSAAPLHPISPLLFGQFMELGVGEPGPDAALEPGTQRMRADVMERFRELAPPIIRYPGGNRVTEDDWSIFLDRTPSNMGVEAAPTKPKVRFTLDPFLQLCAQMRAQPLLVVNCRSAILQERDLTQAARSAARLVAYCNAPANGHLPPDLQAWADTRAANGHPAPYNVKYWEIGNEIWHFNGPIKKKLGVAYPRWHASVIEAYVTAMRAVTPDLILMSDAIDPTVTHALRRHVGNGLNYVSEHKYKPWAYRSAEQDGQRLLTTEFSQAETWNAWVAVPEINPDSGLSVFRPIQAKEAEGYPIAVTEWNFHAFARKGAAFSTLQSSWAAGVGAAGFLHGLLRRSDRIVLATQSVMVGSEFRITSVRVSPTNAFPAYLMPTGAVTGFYRRHVRANLYNTTIENSPFFFQPWKIGNLTPTSKIATLDALSTGDAGATAVHFINRHFNEDLPVRVVFEGGNALASQGQLEVMTGQLDDDFGAPQHAPLTHLDTTPIEIHNGVATFTLPARSVACLTVARSGGR